MFINKILNYLTETLLLARVPKWGFEYKGGQQDISMAALVDLTCWTSEKVSCVRGQPYIALKACQAHPEPFFSLCL
jgi:hypothetical protein